jgi:hypothetical protein
MWSRRRARGRGEAESSFFPCRPSALSYLLVQSVVTKRTNCRANAPWVEIRNAAADRPDEEHGPDHEESRNDMSTPKG